jgi:flagellar hook-associated protein 3 FlgL
VTTIGPPSGYSVNFASAPKAGDAMTFNFNLPDGTTTAVTLTATTSTSPGPNEFTIGATPAATGANFKTALTTALTVEGKTSLNAASAMAASNNFFSVDDTHPPMRVNGPPFDTATSLIAGTSNNTVRWYKGEDDGTPARSGSTARVDTAITVSYGMRANEQAMRLSVSSIAVMAAMKFDTSDPNNAVAYQAMTQRVGATLSNPPGTQKITDIEAEVANAQVIMKASTDRQTQTQSAISSMLDSVQGVPTEQIGAQILALQTRLQASLQTTALLAKTSLVNYLQP